MRSSAVTPTRKNPNAVLRYRYRMTLWSVGFDRPGAAAEYVTVPVSSVLREPASGRTWRRAGCGRAQPVQGMSTSFLPLARPAATRVNAAGPSRSG